MPRTAACFLVEAAYVEGAAERRAPYREEHLERMAKLAREGAVLLAGAFGDLSGSVLVFALETEEAVEAIMSTDVYWREGVWTGYTVRRVNRVVL